MDLDQFYVTLPSNVNTSTHPNNTLANFTCQLYHPLKFDYPYEVALVEITFPPTVDESEKTIIGRVEITHFSSSYSNEANHLEERPSVEVTLGEFRDPKFHENLNENLAKAARRVFCVPEPKFEKIINVNSVYRLNQFQNEYGIYIYGDLADLMGFSKSEAGAERRIGPGAVSRIFSESSTKQITTSLNAYFVYTDIIKHQFVGNSYTQLLRFVALENNKANQTLTYSSPHYVPLSKNYIDSIEISIKDDSGQPVHFKSGIQKVYVKLHFRPKRYGL